MRWPTNAISLIARACRLDTEGNCKMFRALRKAPVEYVRELWLVGMDRRHAAENTLARNTKRENSGSSCNERWDVHETASKS